ncbi:MAG: DUF4032 domain-containing protein [Jatrophihabitantaceae bacterium]
MGSYHLTTLGTNAALLDLPFETPLEQWPDDLIVHVPRGISRHVVRFVRLDDEVFAVKEANDRYVLREHAVLQALANRSVPVVDAYGTVIERVTDDGTALGGLLITRHLEFSQPYRALFTGRSLPQLRARLLDALAELFVRLHLAGFYWGDCSLSNTLFRRDAGALAAYLVDAETAEMHPQLSPGQRAQDMSIATENIAGEMFDLRAAALLDPSIEPIETATELGPRYEQLWDELTHDEVVGRDESYRINARVKRLNSLGFDVSEITIHTEQDGRRLRFETHVVEPGHHSRRVFALTGLRVQENQARTLLAGLARFRAKLNEAVGQDLPEDLTARRWLDEKFFGTLRLVPWDLRRRMPDAELFHEISEHRWFLSEAQGRDVGRAAAVTSYVENVLRFLPDTRVDLSSGPPTEEFEPIFD